MSLFFLFLCKQNSLPVVTERIMAEGENKANECKSPTKQASELIFGASSLEYQVEQFIKSGGQSVKILVSGKTGVGKSHLTNALIGEELAEEGWDVDPQTDEVS